MNWYQPEKEVKKKKDHFLIGLIPALILPFTILMALIKQNTDKDIPYIISKLFLIINHMGGNKLMVSILPNLVLLFVFYMLKKEKGSVGTFVGTVPYLIIMFWVF